MKNEPTKHYRMERNEDGTPVEPISQLDFNGHSDDTLAHWGLFDEARRPRAIREIEREQADLIEYLLSHEGDDR